MRSPRRTINEPTRVNLLGNSIVLIAPKDSKIDNVTIGPGFDLAKLAGDGKIATGDVKGGAGRQIRQGGAGKTRRVAGGGAEIRDGGERARRADAGGARRSRARDRLFDRRQGRARRQDRRHLPGGFPSADHLSRSRRRRPRSRKPPTISPSCARRRPRPSSRNTASSFWSARRPERRVRTLANGMDGDPALAAGRRGRDAGGDAARHRRRGCWRGAISGANRSSMR